jgi:hypothetical protein
VIVLFGFFLLPDLSASSGVIQVYNKFKKASPDIFIPAPPIDRHRDTFDLDKIRLEQKVKEFNDVDSGLEKPDIQQPQRVPIVPIPVPDSVKNPHHGDHHKSKSSSTDSSTNDVYNIDGQDQDPVARKRRDKVKEVSCVISTLNTRH